MRHLTSRIVLALVLLTVSRAVLAADTLQDIADRTLIRELMDRYGLVHDSGTPEEYADLFTADGEIAVAPGGPAIVKGREALMAQARRDHECFGNEPAANGKQLGFGGWPLALELHDGVASGRLAEPLAGRTRE